MAAELHLDAYLASPTRLIRDHLILESGRTYGELIEPWQEQFFEAVFATRPDGTPLHRLLYEERRRGESKTEDCAAAAVADLLTGPARHRSYAVAGDEDQAAILVDSILGFKSRSPMLADLVVERGKVRNLATGSELRVLASDVPTSYGIRPRRVWFDEFSLQVGDRLWTSMWSAIGKNPRSQAVLVSMAGWDFASIAWRVRELAASNPAYYFATREGSALAPWLSAEMMGEQQETLHPADFARFWLCKWTEPIGSWITREMYDGCEVGREAVQGDGSSRYAGFVDVGLVHDATAIAVCHAEGEGDDQRVVLDALHTLQGTRHEPVELAVVEDLVADLTERFKVRSWIFEAPQAVASVQRLQARLVHAKVAARYPTAETQAKLWGSLYQLFATRRLVLYPHEQLRREALSLVTRTAGGRLKVVDSSSIHQDHVIALGGAAEMLLSARTERRDALPVLLSRSRYRGSLLRPQRPSGTG
jgi:hypothetical protein